MKKKEPELELTLYFTQTVVILTYDDGSFFPVPSFDQ